MTPAVVRTTMHTANRRCAGTPGFPCAVVLTAYAAFSPEPNSSGLRRRRIGDCSKARSGPTISIDLTPATGARTTGLHPTPQHRSSACHRSFTSRKPALRPHFTRDAAASTASRPHVRDDGQRPSFGPGRRSFSPDSGRLLASLGVAYCFTECPVLAASLRPTEAHADPLATY
jgi:hypothetical protein